MGFDTVGSVLGSEPLTQFEYLFRWKSAIIQAKKFLRENVSADFFLWVSGYLDFARRVFWNVEKYGHVNAVPYVEADISVFQGWGFDRTVLAALVGLQSLSL